MDEEEEGRRKEGRRKEEGRKEEEEVISNQHHDGTFLFLVDLKSGDQSSVKLMLHLNQIDVI